MRNYRIRSDTVRRAHILLTLCTLATLSSLTSGKSIVTQKIGFAGGLQSEESKEKERSPIFSAAATSTNYHPNDFHHPNHQNYGDHHHPHGHSSPLATDNNKIRRIEYNKLPAYGPRSQPEYDRDRDYITNSVSPSPFKKYYTLEPTDDYHSQQSISQPEPKKYAFAYAVRDGYRGDDFSHKESRDGKVTMGEYKVLLPDGRLQVVRYTADALAGYKADITYEGEDHPHLMPNKSTPKPTLLSPSKSPFGQPSSAVHKKYVVPPSPKSDQIYIATPIKTHPSLSPSIVYSNSDHNDEHYVIHRSIPNHGHSGGHNLNSIQPSSPSPSSHPVIYKLSPTPYTFKKQLAAPPNSPTYASFLRNPINIGPSPTTATYYSPTPKNIYEKIHASQATPSKEPYSAIPRGYRAGPASPTKTFKKIPVYKVVASPSPGPTSATVDTRKIIKIVPTPGEPFTRKSRLVPIELFKAGPLKEHDLRNTHRQGPAIVSADYESNAQPQHYIIEHHDDGHHHHHHQQQPQQLQPQYQDHHVEEHHPPPPAPRAIPQDFPPIKSSLATFTSSLGSPTPKPSLYIKSKPLVAVGRPVRPSIGGLVYLETPGHGPRPNSVGVKELLERIPHDNLPRAKTTTHPYEAGSSDYGSDVSYGIGSSTPSVERQDKSFIPSQQIPEEYLPKLETDRFRHHSREYLTDGKQDSIVRYKGANADFGGRSAEY